MAEKAEPILGLFVIASELKPGWAGLFARVYNLAMAEVALLASLTSRDHESSRDLADRSSRLASVTMARTRDHS